MRCRTSRKGRPETTVGPSCPKRPANDVQRHILKRTIEQTYLPLAWKVAVAGGYAKEEPIVVAQCVCTGDGVVGLGRCVHPIEDFLGQGLGHSGVGLGTRLIHVALTRTGRCSWCLQQHEHRTSRLRRLRTLVSLRVLSEGVVIRTLANMAIHGVYHDCDSGRHGVQVQVWFGLTRGIFDALRVILVLLMSLL